MCKILLKDFEAILKFSISRSQFLIFLLSRNLFLNSLIFAGLTVFRTEITDIFQNIVYKINKLKRIYIYIWKSLEIFKVGLVIARSDK